MTKGHTMTERIGFALKVGIPPDDYDKFSVMPQVGH
jgi:hypothetical protein